MDALLKQSLEALGLPVIAPEPEMLRADLARVKARALARVIAGLINDNEPLLRADADGTTVTVRELGDNGVMRVTVES